MKLRTQDNNKRSSRKNNRTIKAIALTCIAIVILSNTPPAQFFLLENYTYQNADRSFTYSEEPGKGMDLVAGKIQFEGWKTENPENPNKTLLTYLLNDYNLFPSRMLMCNHPLKDIVKDCFFKNRPV